MKSIAAYPLILGAVVSALLTIPIGIGGAFQFGAWLYVGFVIAAVTFVVDRLLRGSFGRWASPAAFVLIPIVASGFGIVAGWLAVTQTMGGPT